MELKLVANGHGFDRDSGDRGGVLADLDEQDRFSPDPDRPARLLRACPAYEASPLRSLESDLADSLLIKDESNRMGLGAFKSLGGVYAVARLIEDSYTEETGIVPEPEQFLDAAIKAHAESMVFVCASAGNHGMAVAAGAKLFGAQARVHLAKTVPESFVGRLEALGAEVVRSGEDYEASMAAAENDASENGAILLADGSWPGYTYTPSLVMEGYTVIAEELRSSFEESGEWPTHVFLQAGVGGLAAAIAHMIRRNWAVQPTIVVVEPYSAPCVKRGIEKQRIVTADGPNSIMGRLDCKVASLLALDVLSECADEIRLISDFDAINAVKLAEKLGVATTPSGASGLAGLMAYARDAGGILEDARPLVIVSEGTVAD